MSPGCPADIFPTEDSNFRRRRLRRSTRDTTWKPTWAATGTTRLLGDSRSYAVPAGVSYVVSNSLPLLAWRTRMSRIHWRTGSRVPRTTWTKKTIGSNRTKRTTHRYPTGAWIPLSAATSASSKSQSRTSGKLHASTSTATSASRSLSEAGTRQHAPRNAAMRSWPGKISSTKLTLSSWLLSTRREKSWTATIGFTARRGLARLSSEHRTSRATLQRAARARSRLAPAARLPPTPATVYRMRRSATSSSTLSRRDGRDVASVKWSLSAWTGVRT